MHFVFAPVFHEYEDIPSGAHNCVEPPEQIEVFPLMKQFGELATDTYLLHELVQPAELVTVTV